jgi:hypothetical protein
MHFFVGHDISRSVVAMRLANAALFVGLLTAAYWLLPRRRRTMLVAGTVVALVPLGMFLIPSVNASGWAITSAAVVFPAVVGYFETPGRRRWALAGLALLGTVVGAGARADSAVYTVLAAALATFLAFRWRTDARRLLALPLAIGLMCVGFYFSAGQSELASTGLRGSAQPGSTAVQLAWNLLNVPSLWAGAMGTSWGLGWLDTGLPAVVGVLGLAAFGALAFTGLRQPGRRKVVALLVVGFAAWAVPTAMLVQSHALVGAQVQPRYVLPLLITLSQVALFRLPATRPQISRAQLYTVAAALLVTNAVSLQTDIRRYVTGLDIFSWNLDRNREWWWAIPASPMAVWAAGAVAFGAALLFGVPALARSDESAEAVPDAGAVRPSGTARAIDAPPQRAAA